VSSLLIITVFRLNMARSSSMATVPSSPILPRPGGGDKHDAECDARGLGHDRPVARLTYAMLCSLDGYAVDAGGDFGWAMPSPEVHQFVNDLERDVGTYLYGRRMYEVMRFWETVPTGSESAASEADPDEAVMRDFAALWQAAEKVVYSTSLTEVTTPRTRLEAAFDPDAVRALKTGASQDLAISGPTLAAQAFAAGLVDEVHLLLFPVIVGGGTPALPIGERLDLELRSQRTFADGTVHLHYVVR
jgi:dihydrofolate reductase